MAIVRNHGILERGLKGLGMEFSSEVKAIGIEVKGVIGKGDCQGGDGRMKHLLIMWGSRGRRSWTHGEG